MAFSECKSAQNDNSQFIDFGSLESDHDDANWVLKPYKRN